MALPIAPTPVLTGKSAARLDRYMRESEFKRERIVPRKLDMAEIEKAHARMMERRAKCGK